MKQDVIDNIQKMTVNGNRLELPTDEQFKNYPAVKKVLITAGGKYSKCGFVFKDDDPAKVKARLVGGEVINDKKDFQQFYTPEPLALKIIGMSDLKPGMRVLEPSCGRAHIVKHIPVMCDVYCIELDPKNVQYCREEWPSLRVKPADFLTVNPDLSLKFDRIIANPPFTKNQDIEHIRHMYRFLKKGGMLTSIASPSWTFGSQKKQVAFREWLAEVEGEIIQVPEGAFKESGTNIRTVIVQIKRG